VRSGISVLKQHVSPLLPDPSCPRQAVRLAILAGKHFTLTCRGTNELATQDAAKQGRIRTFRLSLPLHMGYVNCYLVQVDAGYVLIDTGSSNKRAELERELESAGCQPGNVRLIVLTHGDFDHSGNAAYLRKRFDTKAAMHRDDWGMVERGDMFWNRRRGIVQRLIGALAPMLSGFGKGERLIPDLNIEDGDDLSTYGFDAKVLSVPGHSRGSVAILTAAGDLFCGDLFTNTEEPALNSVMDDREAARESADKLKGMKIITIYPGHGKPFRVELLTGSS